MKSARVEQAQKPPAALAFRSSKKLILTSICVAIFTVRGLTHSMASASRPFNCWLNSIYKIYFYMVSLCL